MVDVVIEPGEVGCGDRTFAVTILSTEHFDAWQVDPASVRFGPAGAGVEHRSRYPEDVDGDGDLDMVLHFQAAATGLTASADQGWVTARTFLGVEITGTDSLSSSVKELLSVHCVS